MDLGQGPNQRRGIRGGSLRATEPRPRETTRGRKRKKSAQVPKKQVCTSFQCNIARISTDSQTGSDQGLAVVCR